MVLALTHPLRRIAADSVLIVSIGFPVAFPFGIANGKRD
jgi:hypothetical protein